MNTDDVLFPLGAKMAACGGMIWLVLLASTVLDALRLSTLDLLFLLAPSVVVPLSLNLIPHTAVSGLSRIPAAIVRCLLFPGATLTTVSFFLPVGRAAGTLAGLWLIVGMALALDGLNRLIRTRLKSFQEFCHAAGEGYALVGALWLVASRLGLQPAGFHEPVVLLTAIHFHYAGLMAATLAGLVASSRSNSMAMRAALSCALLGPGLMGLAFLVGPRLKLAAVGLLVIGECGLAFGTFRVGLSAAAGIGGRLLLVGSASVIVGMTLAAVWALGEYPLHGFVNIEQMARYHGVLNSVGFGLCTLAGWTLSVRNRS